MNEALIRINNISVYGYGLLTVFSFLWGSFVFYKKSVESHYDEKTVFDSVVLAGFWSFIIGRLVYAVTNLSVFGSHLSRIFLLTNYPGLDRYGAICGLLLGLWLCLRKTKEKFLDWLDFVFLGVSAGTAVFFAGLTIIGFLWQLLLLSFLYLFIFIYFWRIEKKYRTYEWYRFNKTSAKSGFITGFSIAMWGILLGIEKILMGGVGWEDILRSGVLFVGGLVLVYIRSGRVASDDIKNFVKHGKR